MTRAGYGLAYYQLDILESSGKKVPFGPDLLSKIESVQVEQVWDGADAITITMRAWDEFEANFAVVGSYTLEPGTSIILRAGYGKGPPTTMGRFTIVQHEPTFDGGGVPIVVITGYDGFSLLMDNQFPGDYGGAAEGTLTYTDVARLLARKYGFGLAADQSPNIPHKTKTKRVRKRVNGKTVRIDGKVQRKSVKKQSKIIKNAGDTDAKMMKDLANYSGFLLPKVRYIESSDSPIVNKLHRITENTRNRDVLFFRRANIRRQLATADAFDFTYRRPSGQIGTLSQFSPTWNTDNVPLSVRVTGVVKATVGTKRKRTKKRIHVVEAQLTDPEQLRLRSNLLRRAAREKNPLKAQELRDKAKRIEPQITVVRETTTKLTKRDKKRFKNVGTAMIEVLDKERRPVKEYDRVKKRKLQTMRREVIGQTLVVTDGAELRKIAKGWLTSRLQLHIVADTVVDNVPKSETLYPNQVHTASGLPIEYEGPYMIRTATHVWNAGGAHQVSMHWQRVAEVSSKISTAESTED